MKELLAAIFLAASVAVVLPACTKTSDKPGAEKTITTNNQEQALTNRANSRWAAILDRNYDAAYEFESPTYRSINDSAHFKMQFAGQVVRESATVEAIEWNSEDKLSATVVIEIAFSTVLGGQLIQTSDYARETWVMRDGQWWHVSKQ